MTKNHLITAAVIVAVLVGTYFLLSRSPQAKTDLSAFPDLNQLSVSPTVASAQPTLSMATPPAPSIDSLKIEDLTVGTGPEVKSGDTVTMNYVGTLTDGTKFDSSYDRNQPFTTQIGVGQVIKGWDQGVPGMKVGGKRRLTIPASLAYGAQGVPGAIPPNATLVFEVELVAIK